MKFYIFKNDYLRPPQTDKLSVVYWRTSVKEYSGWFFDCISRFGEIVPLDEKIREEELAGLLKTRDAIFLLPDNSMDIGIDWRRVPRRILDLTLGRLLIPRNIYNSKIVPSAQIGLVSTKYQADRMKSYFGGLVPELRVFPPKIDTDFYTIPDAKQRLAARRKEGIKEGQFHIVYAGRLIVTKGICQLIRTLDIWPIPGVILTLVGNIDYQAFMVFSFADHKTFQHFLNEEILQRKARPWLRFRQAETKEELRDLFWSADLFVNPSVHPDENFGITPREAVSCGVPVVTTNFCGLKSLAEGMPWKGIDTYPTHFGSRFSLRQLRDLLRKAYGELRLFGPQNYRRQVLKECDTAMSIKNLEEAILYLINKAPEAFLNDAKRREWEIKKRLFNSSDLKFYQSYIEARTEFPKGAYIYGDRTFDPVLPMVQGIYSSRNAPPQIGKGSRWRGFSRIALWRHEKAVVEFGFPGPRIRRYTGKSWNSLIACLSRGKPQEYVFIPRDNMQVSLIQELVDLGYLVSDDITRLKLI